MSADQPSLPSAWLKSFRSAVVSLAMLLLIGSAIATGAGSAAASEAGTGSLSGTVTGTFGVTVGINVAGGTYYPPVTTTGKVSRAEFRISGLASGTYEFFIFSEKGQYFFSDPIVLADGEAISDLNFVVNEPTVFLSASMRGSMGSWAKARLEVREDDGSWIFADSLEGTPTRQFHGYDTFNAYFTDLAPGYYRVIFSSEWGIDDLHEYDLRVRSHEGWYETQDRAFVRGTVVDSTGRPASGAVVLMAPGDGRNITADNTSVVTTNSSGWFEVWSPSSYGFPVKIWVGNAEQTNGLVAPRWIGGTTVESAALFLNQAGDDVQSAPLSTLTVDRIPTFSDVTTRTQFRTSIAWVSANGIAKGYPDGTFRPVTPVARDAMAAFLYRLAGSPEFTPPTDSPFIDVSPTNQFYKEISWLERTGVSRGWTEASGSRTFRPLEPVTREAMAAFLYRHLGSPVVTLPGTPHFSDVPRNSQFYREITWMKDAGISTGWPNAGTSGAEYRPGLPVNRDAMAAFMERTRKDGHCVPTAMDVFLPTACDAG